MSDIFPELKHEEEILKLLLNGVDLEQDLFLSEGILDVLNHASDLALYGSKLGIDATRKINGEPARNIAQHGTQSPNPEITESLVKKFPAIKNCRLIQISPSRPILLVSFNKTGPGQAAEYLRDFLAEEAFSQVGVLLVLEAHVDLNNTSQVLWKLFNNLDPKRDIQISGQRMGIDVTRKLPEEGYQQNWPEEIVMTEKIIQKVDQKWHQILNV